jgi:hypothetical protein
MAQTKKLKLQEMKEFIKGRVAKILESENAKNLGEPLKVDMNSMVKDGGKLGTSPKADDPIVADMNTEAKSGTENTGAQVAVKAGEAKGDKGPTAGQANAKMEEKTSADASVKAGEPFLEKPKEGMNNMDDEGEKGAKTYVEAGDGSVGSQPTTVGQKKPSFDESAPKSEEKDRISDAIQMKEGMTFKNKAELINFIKGEAKRISKLI